MLIALKLTDYDLDTERMQVGFLPCKRGIGYRSLSNAKEHWGSPRKVSGCPAGLLLMPAWTPHLWVPVLLGGACPPLLSYLQSPGPFPLCTPLPPPAMLLLVLLSL